MVARTVRLIECARDAMQGWQKPIPTDVKVRYLNALLDVGFYVVDAGSFVSAKAVPQMADTPEVLHQLKDSRTLISVVVANARYAEQALAHPRVNIVGYPFSISEEFLQRNLRTTQKEALTQAEQILEMADQKSKQALIYLSMAFGNPYGEEWSPSLVVDWTGELFIRGACWFSVADTAGVADPDRIHTVCEHLVKNFPDCQFSLHLHTRPGNEEPLLEGAWHAGIRSFEGALGGYGGCPFAQDELVGNINTRALLHFLKKKNALPPLNHQALQQAEQLLPEVFAS